MKAATPKKRSLYRFLSISIHAAREGGDTFGFMPNFPYRISIHAAREGGDVSTVCYLPHANRFQSTPPVKAATIVTKLYERLSNISIHAAREGGDVCILSDYIAHMVFQSTPPVKAATF